MPKPTKMEKINNARRRLVKEQRWVKDHGGSLEAYVERYGSKDNPDHYGDGGEAIWEADLGALRMAETFLAILEDREPRDWSRVLGAAPIGAEDLQLHVVGGPDIHDVTYNGVLVGKILFLGDQQWAPNAQDGFGGRIVGSVSEAVEILAQHLSEVGTPAYLDALAERHNAFLRFQDAEGRWALALSHLNKAQEILQSFAKPA